MGIFLWAGESCANNLTGEDSPYLQQHAHNPVNWYPWGGEAFEKAKREKKLIFLSIGYSTCHWCHVMEEESFEDAEVAKLLNRDYISIKVDREVHPQIDQMYQRLYRKVKHKSGGWPLTIFLTPDRKPFYIGTYIPKEAGYGSEGLIPLLSRYARLFGQKPEEIASMAKAYAEPAQNRPMDSRRDLMFNHTYITRLMTQFKEQYDPLYGGFSRRPKFPETSKILLLLDLYKISGDAAALKMAKETAEQMALGGLYDQIDGGFFRYTTDRKWRIPHFEKMLYTNAELISAYVKLYLIEPRPLYRKVIRETIAEMDRHFLRGGLYLSASDADSDGEEGGYYIYNYGELKGALESRGLKKRDIREALAYLGIEEDGNIDGELSHTHIVPGSVPARLEEVKAYLREIRGERSFPFVDEKIITAWNAMMIKALFAAGRIERRYAKEGSRRLKALLSKMSRGWNLYHQALLGREAKQAGMLEDYACLVDALIEAYQLDFEESYLDLARGFSRKALSLFYRKGVWYLSSDDANVPANSDDRLYSSALGVMLSDLLALAALTEDLKLAGIVGRTLDRYSRVLKDDPLSASRLTTVFLKEKMGIVVVKSNKTDLRKAEREIEKIDYPFVLLKAENINRYTACKITACFAESQTIGKLIETIEAEKEALIDRPKRRWRQAGEESGHHQKGRRAVNGEGDR